MLSLLIYSPIRVPVSQVRGKRQIINFSWNFWRWFKITVLMFCSVLILLLSWYLVCQLHPVLEQQNVHRLYQPQMQQSCRDWSERDEMQRSVSQHLRSWIWFLWIPMWASSGHPEIASFFICVKSCLMECSHVIRKPACATPREWNVVPFDNTTIGKIVLL